MSVVKIILCLYITSFAVHYGWRMRGTVIGGEKGAMLPGLLAGLSLSLFAGGEIAKLFYIPAAAGLIGMSYGGIEPYGDSISMIEDTDIPYYNPKKGLFGLALKGALWFSIGGGYIGMGFFAMSGNFSVYDILIFIVMTFICQFIGYKVFNSPYKPEEGLLPKIYLSYESRDEWGSNVGVLLLTISFAIIKKNNISLLMCACGFIFGAIGWLIAMRLYYYTDHPFKNGKFLYGWFNKKKLVGAWSNMEFCIGTFGGFGIALGFLLSKNNIDNINNYLTINGIQSLLTNDFIIIFFFIFLSIALFALNSYEYYCDKNGKKYNTFIMDCIERPLFNTLPFAMVLTCSLTASKLMTLYMILYCLFLKNSFDRLKPGKLRIATVSVTAILCIIVFAACVYVSDFNFIWLILAGTFPYIFSEIIWKIIDEGRESLIILKKLNGFSFMMLLLSIQSIILIVLSVIYNTTV